MGRHHDDDWLSGTPLVELEPGPLPIIPKPMWAEISDWLASWRHGDALRKAGLMPPGALLLHGPTGTGKTSLSRAILAYMPDRRGCIIESHNVVNGLLGSSAQNVARAFNTAEKHDALLVIEEIDALGRSRQDSGTNLREEESRITISLMRHLEAATMPVIATTNHKAALDAALVRRFELCLEVSELPEKGRAKVLREILKRDPEPELVALPLTESIRIAHRLRRREFIAELERKK